MESEELDDTFSGERSAVGCLADAVCTDLTITHNVLHGSLTYRRPALEYFGSEEERSAIGPSGSLLDEALSHP